MFLLVPAYPGSPGEKAVKRLCVCGSSLLLFLRCGEYTSVGSKDKSVVAFRAALIIRHWMNSVKWLKSLVRYLSAWSLYRSWML